MNKVICICSGIWPDCFYQATVKSLTTNGLLGYQLSFLLLFVRALVGQHYQGFFYFEKINHIKMGNIEI